MGNATRLKAVYSGRFAAGQTKEKSVESPPASQSACVTVFCKSPKSNPNNPPPPLNDTAEHSEGKYANEAELPQLLGRRLEVQLSEHVVV